MLIKNRRSWEIAENEATPESAFFNRRNLIKTVGLAALIGGVAGCNETSSAAQTGPAGGGGNATASLYPFKRDTKYTIKRAITPEQIVTTYNNYYEFGSDKDIYPVAQRLTIHPWEISIEGMVEKPFKIDFDTLLKQMPREERLYRHRCVETWSFTAPWSGFAMRALIDLAKPTNDAKYVVMKSFMDPRQAPGQNQIFYPWPYTEGLTLAEARNDLAFMVTGVYGKPLPKQNGAPIRLAVPWKYGFKSAKGIRRFIFTDKQPKSFWQALASDEYGFWANVNPNVPHPRWSQATEEPLGTGKRIPTQIYNGYGEQVAGLYKNMNLPDTVLFR